jgi:starvation-inducible DNA-binding protein
MEAKIGIEQGHLQEVATTLNRILADEFLLYIKSRNAHWNVEGNDFYAKHKFFENQYEELDEIIDDIAERIRALGHFPVASLKKILKLTHLTDESSEENDSADFIKDLLSDHEQVIMELRRNINTIATDLHDLGTSDFINGLMEKHEKMAWMLRAHLK